MELTVWWPTSCRCYCDEDAALLGNRIYEVGLRKTRSESSEASHIENDGILGRGPRTGNVQLHLKLLIRKDVGGDCELYELLRCSKTGPQKQQQDSHWRILYNQRQSKDFISSVFHSKALLATLAQHTPCFSANFCILHLRNPSAQCRTLWCSWWGYSPSYWTSPQSYQWSPLLCP